MGVCLSPPPAFRTINLVSNKKPRENEALCNTLVKKPRKSDTCLTNTFKTHGNITLLTMYTYLSPIILMCTNKQLREP